MSYAALSVLGTPRLTLRPLTVDDAEAIAAGIGNFDVSKWLAVVPYPYGLDDACDFIDRVMREERMVWAICDVSGLVGLVGIEDELGYWLARPAWGRGYAFEAAQAVVQHWYSHPSNGDLESGHFDGNDRSAAILRALGFLREGSGFRFARSLSQEVPATDMLITRTRWEARQGFEISTARMTIRPFEEGDAPAFAGMAVAEVARNMATIPIDMGVEEARAYLSASRFRGLPGFRLAIVRGARLIGAIGFGGTPPDVAFFLAPDQWGQGLATEALSAFLPEVFERFPVSRVAAEHFEDNPAPGRVLKKLGFVETGRQQGTSKARLEPAPVITYAVTRETLRVYA
jgi:RimJ/RimL family protein N-acetyltransferase